MVERFDGQNNELIGRTSELVRESVGRFDVDDLEGIDSKEIIRDIFKSVPEHDMDRDAWSDILGLSYIGYHIENPSSTPESFALDLKGQLKGDEVRWGDTWRQRSVKGQLDRTYKEFEDYTDQYLNGVNQEFPWLRVAGNVVICLTRIDNPDYRIPGSTFIFG